MKLYKQVQLNYFFKISTHAFLLSILFSILALWFNDIKITISILFSSSIKVFLGILPIIFLKQKNFLFKDGPLKSSCLILYYLLIVPIVDIFLELSEIDKELKYFFYFLSFINVLLLITSHIMLLKYVFTDFFKRKRQIVPNDITIIITTYITLAISFGLVYTIISFFSDDIAFNNIPKTLEEFEFYFRHIYFSFITITTIGYGDIYPLTTIGQFLVMIEVITGMILTNVILGLVIGSGIFYFKNR
ncbi:potassium channel family protein [Fusobacterium mortiferum]|jgi:voltage-gated potassium channel|uniref:Two pore domain potassium channel family protein n=4 Tax=Fusobacterium TaxID=848 RepID=A0A414PQD8_FUSMR|nr:potassium channel family protein [Fusobacterium mortiferum]AVQ19884.1 two pore domain potassium channel family protein [Fusobacterium mortiferum ATCC 9817]EEO35678.1 Ion channel [Fusobacterium mortiferum ATCC 9817]MCF2700152.1 two pore domain potassium channel family protein [Fusobacterium mortiferum]MCI6382236.1 potassium channel family protein [Fusobacterium mortiferum]MCI7188975.1 potassium channel family protein [Fusobacterium mortiferum]